MEERLTFWRLICDVRSERALRYAAIYASCLVCYFFWDFEVKTSSGVKVADSRDYWSILLVVASVSIASHYSIGFFGLMYQALVVVIVICGVILTPVIPALVSSTWAGYLVVCSMFTLIVGPLFGGVEPAVLHLYAFSCAVIIEFIYTPLIEPSRGVYSYQLTIDNLWRFGIANVMVNLGMFMAISMGIMLLPPWRTARSQLHHRAGQVLDMLAESLAAVTMSGDVVSVKGEVTLSSNEKRLEVTDGNMVNNGPEDVGAPGQNPLCKVPISALKQNATDPVPAVNPEWLFAGLSPSKDSIEELSSFTMLEPSLLHIGTLGAHPDAWKVFTREVYNTYGQASAIRFAVDVAKATGQLTPSVEAAVADAVLAAAAVVRALAAGARVERRGAATRWRSQVRAELDSAQEAGAEAVQKLGLLLLDGDPSSDGQSGMFAVALFVALASMVRRGSGISLGAAARPGEGCGIQKAAAATDPGEGSAGGPASMAMRRSGIKLVEAAGPGDGNGVHCAAAAGSDKGSGINLVATAGPGGESAGDPRPAPAVPDDSLSEAAAANPSGRSMLFVWPADAAAVPFLRPDDLPAAAASPAPAGAGEVVSSRRADLDVPTAVAAPATAAARTAPVAPATPVAGVAAGGVAPHGLWGLVCSVSEIQRQLQLTAPANVIKQVLISCGPLQLVMLIKAWLLGLATIFRPWRLIGRGRVWRQPLNMFYFAQFVVGVWTILAASTYWSAYRNWQGTGGHGATWPLMAFLLVLQPTREATIQKALMRIIATVCGVMIAYGLTSVSEEPRWLIPISTLVVAGPFWLLPDNRSCVKLRVMGDLMYFCISFTFAYSMTMGYSGVYGIRQTVLTRLVSQILGCVVAMVVAIVIFPISGVATATGGAVEALAEMSTICMSLADILRSNRRRGEEDGEALKSPQQPERAQWEELGERRTRVKEAFLAMTLQLVSLRAYPLSTAVARRTEGAQLMDMLHGKYASVGRSQQLVDSLVTEVKRLIAIPTSDSDSELIVAVEHQLVNLAANLEQQRRDIHTAFKARPFSLRMPYMPVYFAGEDGISASAAEAALVKNGEAAAAAGVEAETRKISSVADKASSTEGGQKVSAVADVAISMEEGRKASAVADTATAMHHSSSGNTAALTGGANSVVLATGGAAALLEVDPHINAGLARVLRCLDRGLHEAVSRSCSDPEVDADKRRTQPGDHENRAVGCGRSGGGTDVRPATTRRSQVKAQLHAYLVEGGGELAVGLERFHVGYLLYIAHLTSMN